MAAELIPYRQQLINILERADVTEEICGTIANGGDLITWCRVQNIRYSDVMVWLNSDKERSRVYQLALVARDEWLVQELMNELKNIGLADLRDAYNNDGSLKAPKDWPEGLARAIAAVETDELFEGAGKDREHVGFTKKLKLWPKLDAIKIMLQKVGALIEKKEVLHTFDATTRMQELEERRRAARQVIDVVPAVPDSTQILKRSEFGSTDQTENRSSTERSTRDPDGTGAGSADDMPGVSPEPGNVDVG